MSQCLVLIDRAILRYQYENAGFKTNNKTHTSEMNIESLELDPLPYNHLSHNLYGMPFNWLNEIDEVFTRKSELNDWNLSVLDILETLNTEEKKYIKKTIKKKNISALKLTISVRPEDLQFSEHAKNFITPKLPHQQCR